MCVSPVTMWTIPKWWNTCPKKNDNSQVWQTFVVGFSNHWGNWWNLMDQVLIEPTIFTQNCRCHCFRSMHFLIWTPFSLGVYHVQICSEFVWSYQLITTFSTLYLWSTSIVTSSFFWYILCSQSFSKWLNKKHSTFITSPSSCLNPGG